MTARPVRGMASGRRSRRRDSERTPRLACALYRHASYSPNQHGTNDTAILDAVIETLEPMGWTVRRASEAGIVSGDVDVASLGDADLVLNMCQGPVASARLLNELAPDAPIVNRPSSVLACHRHQLVAKLAGRALAFPRTAVISTATPYALDGFGANGQLVWVKRGDVHAERSEDVVAVRRADLRDAIDAFRARGIGRVALQEHVPGPVVKFYGVADGSFFRFYGAEGGPQEPVPPVDADRLQEMAFEAAAALGLGVFGGDAALAAPDAPVLIDVNDWPSFAPFRDEAARHIAAYAHKHAITHLTRES